MNDQIVTSGTCRRRTRRRRPRPGAGRTSLSRKCGWIARPPTSVTRPALTPPWSPRSCPYTTTSSSNGSSTTRPELRPAAHSRRSSATQVLTFPRSTSVMIVATRGVRRRLLRRKACRVWASPDPAGADECEGLPTDLPNAKRGPFKELIGQTHMFIFEFGLAMQRADEPVRRGRPASPVDEKRLKGGRQAVPAGRVDRTRDTSRGPSPATPLHRRERDLQQGPAAVHRSHRRQHQPIPQPGAWRASRAKILHARQGPALPRSPRRLACRRARPRRAWSSVSVTLSKSRKDSATPRAGGGVSCAAAAVAARPAAGKRPVCRPHRRRWYSV